MDLLVTLSISLATLFSVSGFAMGPAPQPTPSASPMGVPTPLRDVVITPVVTKPFPLPNGGQIDLSSQLAQLAVTAATQSGAFAPVDSSATDSCGGHIELRAAVTSVELDILDLGITVGYTPTQTYNSLITGATGTADVKVGSVGMDFSLWNCSGGANSECAAVLASHADQGTVSATLNFQVDFGLVTTATQLVYNTPFGQVLQKILQAGVDELAMNPSVNHLPWFATIQEVDETNGSFVFDAGSRSHIGADQTFTVYAAKASGASGGACGVFQAIASAHTIGVTEVSSTAVIDKVLDSRAPQAGDVVMVAVGKQN